MDERGYLAHLAAARERSSPRYLMLFRHKLSRDAMIPISDRVCAQIRRQQQQVLERWPDGRCE